MKKWGLVLLLAVTILVGCGNDIKSKTDNSTPENNSSSENQTSQSDEKYKKVVTSLNETATIASKNEKKYNLTVTEVADVTDEAKNNTINDRNFLDYYSSNQAKQAVRVTIKMENLSKDSLGLPYLDDVKVKDSSGITNIGGWKNDGSNMTEFGYYITDDSGATTQYEIEPGETKLATSTVLLATPSKTISFTFKSELFKDEIEFTIPISN